MQSPSSTHAPITPTAGNAVPKSPSQARVTPPRPTALSAWLTTPVEDNTQLHAIPAATRGTTCGRNNTARATLLTRREAIRRITVATTRPSTTGMPLKKMISWKACPSDPEQLVVGEDGLEVVETDPAGRQQHRPTGRAST